MDATRQTSATLSMRPTLTWLDRMSTAVRRARAYAVSASSLCTSRAHLWALSVLPYKLPRRRRPSRRWQE